MNNLVRCIVSLDLCICAGVRRLVELSCVELYDVPRFGNKRLQQQASIDKCP
jgi:hypothetical protein